MTVKETPRGWFPRPPLANSLLLPSKALCPPAFQPPQLANSLSVICVSFPHSPIGRRAAALRKTRTKATVRGRPACDFWTSVAKRVGVAFSLKGWQRVWAVTLRHEVHQISQPARAGVASDVALGRRWVSARASACRRTDSPGRWSRQAPVA